MSYSGTMEGWHGDETECQGNCGLCSDCDEQFYQDCDEAYEAWRDEAA
jgi:hypothetical protein